MILTWNLNQWQNLTRETRQRQKIDEDFMSANYDFIVIFPIYGQFRAIQKAGSGRMVCTKTYINIH